MTLRGAALEGYKVIGMDSFENGGRIERAAGAGAHCNWIGLKNSINILDVVYDEGDWIGDQTQHVVDLLSLMLGTPGKSRDDKEVYIPRQFTVGEAGVLDLALGDLYATVDPHAPLTAMPLLSDLIRVLDGFGEDDMEVVQLADDLHAALYGTRRRGVTRLNTLGRAFNQHTAIDFNFERDITYFDFKAVPERLRAFYWAYTIGAIYRYMRDPKRDRMRRTLLVIDEFGYAAQVEAVARLAATICKVARKYGIGLLVVDQNPITFLESNNGRFIFENAVAKIIFHLDDLPARQMGEAMSDLTEAHVHRIAHLQKGQCVGVFGNDVYVMAHELNDGELRLLCDS